MSEFLWLLSTPTRKVLLVSGAHALACLALFEYFRRSLGLSGQVLLVHALLVIAALVAALILAGTVARLAGHRRGAPYLAALFPSIVMTALFALDIVSFATIQSMGISLTRSLVTLWLQAWWDGEQLLPISTNVLLGAAVAAGLAVLLEFVIWANTLKEFRPRVSLRNAAFATVVLLMCGYPAFVQQETDPILAFLGSKWTSVDAQQQAIFDRLRQDEPRRRAAYGRKEGFDRKNVILISVDSLRADHLPLYGYTRPTTPFLSRLHQEGTLRRVDFATSICAESNCGISSALSSKTLRHQVAEDFSLFALLKDQGYDVHFVLSGNHDWMGQREMYGNELTSYFDGRDSSRYSWSDDRVLVEGLERIGDHQRPSFFFFHLMSPHIMAPKQERYRLYQPAVVELDMEALFRGRYEQTSVVNNYDNGVVEADATISDLFAVLDRKGYLQNSIVVIFADHGEALGDRAGMYGHINWLYQETIRIPMLIYDASATPYDGLSFGTQLDVAPTVVDRLGLPIPPDWEGVSLLRKAAPRQTMHQTRLAKPCFAVIDYAAKSMLKFMQCDGGKNEQLYDLMVDPRELRDLAQSADPAVIAGFRTALSQWRAR
jgi:glucan phosphoethanolaminetransferase (alkaline phosphatase superfamily)